MTTRVVRGTTYALPPDPVGDANFYWGVDGLIADGKIVLLGLWADQDAYVAVSEDAGETWEINAVPSPGAVHLKYLAWNGAVWCLVGGAGSTNYCATSPDAKTWTARTIAAADAFNNTLRGVVATASGRFVAHPLTGSALQVSDDNGVSWSPRTIPSTASPSRNYGSVYNGTAICIPAFNGVAPHTVQISLDEGETWSDVSLAPSTVTYPGVAYAVGTTLRMGGGIAGVNAFSTDNGATWHKGTEGISGFQYAGSAASNIVLACTYADGGGAQPAFPSLDAGDTWEFATSLIAAGSGLINMALLDEATDKFYIVEDFTISGVVVEEVPDFALLPSQAITLNGETRFHFTVPPGVDLLRVTLTGGRGYADLYLELGAPASWSSTYYSYDFPASVIEITNPTPGAYYGWVDSYGFDGSSLLMTYPFWTGFINCGDVA
jgi:Bacterial pre-peptidase C-terminal domain./BNR/Asp-box repeat.